MIDFQEVKPIHEVNPSAVLITAENVSELGAHFSLDVTHFNDRVKLSIPFERRHGLTAEAFVDDWIVYRPGESRDIEVVPGNKFERAYRLTSAAEQLDDAVRAEVDDVTAYIVIAERPSGMHALFSHDMTPAHAVGIAYVFALRGANR